MTRDPVRSRDCRVKPSPPTGGLSRARVLDPDLTVPPGPSRGLVDDTALGAETSAGRGDLESEDPTLL